MLIEDRSSMEADWRCGMERYWLTEYQSGPKRRTAGIVPVKLVFDLALGSAFADGIAVLTDSMHPGALPSGVRERIELVSKPILDDWGREPYDLIRGLLYGAATHVLPRLLVDYEVMGTEREMYFAWPEPPAASRLMFMCRPDLLLRRKSDATVWVPDWKTTSWKDVAWLTKWPWAIQLHLQAAAVKQTHPEWDVQGSLIFGAYKGYMSEATNLRASPFCNVYHIGSSGPNVTEQWSPKWIRGWNPMPASLYAGGLYGWVDELQRTYPTVLAEQFPMSQPILLRDDFVALVAEERLARLTRIAQWRQGLLPMVDVFDHRTMNCEKCGYQKACWVPAVNRDPTGSGLYVPRVPNHELERVLYDMDHGGAPAS